MLAIFAITLIAVQTEHPQKERLYHAEKLLVDEDPKVKVIPFAEIPQYVDKIYSDPWFKERYKNPKNPIIEKGKFGNNGYSTGNRIGFPPVGTNINILHEIAHQLTPKGMHGPKFARVLVDLVWKFMGQDSADRLRKFYLKQDVNWLQKPNGN